MMIIKNLVKLSKMNKMTLTNDTEDMFYKGNSVIVKYYERKSWKFYIGFIVNVSTESDDIFYTINFLKTVKKPSLKFVTTKINDCDVVPSINVVKKVQLICNSKEYILKNYSSDRFYFDLS